MSHFTQNDDPVFAALFNFNDTIQAFERYLQSGEHTDEATDYWHGLYEARIREVAFAVPHTLEGFAASLDELNHQVSNALIFEPLANWLTSLLVGLHTVQNDQKRASEVSEQRPMRAPRRGAAWQARRGETAQSTRLDA